MQHTPILLKNTSDKPQQFTLQIDYDAGSYVNGLKTIPARQTALFDIRQLRDSKEKDEAGNTLPLTASSGKVSWSAVGPDSHSMIGRIEQYDLTHGVSYSFACSNCCQNSFYNAFTSPEPILLRMGGTIVAVPSQQDVNCYGVVMVPYVYHSPVWAVVVTNIATAQSDGTVLGSRRVIPQ